MSGEPDFDQIAGEIAGAAWSTKEEIIAVLRLVWNARGAADIATVKTELLGSCPDGQHSDPDNSGMCIKCAVVLDWQGPEERLEYLERAIKALDQ